MSTMASQITSLTIVHSTVYSDVDQRKYLSSASPAFVEGIHRWLAYSPHKWPMTRKMFPFDDVIMQMMLQYVVSLYWATQEMIILEIVPIFAALYSSLCYFLCVLGPLGHQPRAN